ncbi:Uridine-cytidine kinase-like 1 [Balamuthia mandrillaris]
MEPTLVSPSQSSPIKKFTFTQGRPPWYESGPAATTAGVKSTKQRTLVIGVAGGTASGKTSVCTSIVKRLNVQWISHLSLDYFYKGLTPEHDPHEYNFDHPDAFDWGLVYETLVLLKKGKRVEVPIYDFKTHQRSAHTKTIYGADVILFEGILALHDKKIRELLDIKIFVHTDADIRLSRRIKRDIRERGRDVMGVIRQYEKFVKPAHDDFVAPTMEFADLIIPKGARNEVAIDLIAKHIESTLQQRGFYPQLSREPPKWTQTPQNIHILEQTPHIRSLHTIVRDENTDLNDFVFFSNRLSRLVIEEALNYLPVKGEEKVITTPTGATYHGIDILNNISNLVFISVMRAGEAMEEAAREVVRNAKVGKILIQSHGKKKPELFYYKMPKKLEDHTVLVLDPTLGTGESMKMALRVLMDHNVPEENLIVVTLVASPQGLQSISYAFPKVQIVAGAMDEALNENYFIIPGIGNFGDRYFGTTTTSNKTQQQT